ncbi:hypothetical protein [Clostridium perfringens]|uniref:hypothetical protein n=1 Tax=Clostridium perfringens TaxID=1502 RepID=UPI0018E44B80|nr:hypothetical protein [Clostridium perfringens]MBI6051758.1 hypothetical protein [Clostridium perfringens]MDM0528850.1 hypothetical protein [Clostridium perfringens]MDM0531825.1 hypothetical protein [Clostridium perfringens]
MKNLNIDLEKMINDKNFYCRTNILSILKEIPFEETLIMPEDDDIFIPFNVKYDEYMKEYKFIYDYIKNAYINCCLNIENRKTNYTVKFNIPQKTYDFLIQNGFVISNFCKFSLYNTNYINAHNNAITSLYSEILNASYDDYISVSVKLNFDEFIIYRILRTLMGVTTVCGNNMLTKYIKYYNSQVSK